MKKILITYLTFLILTNIALATEIYITDTIQYSSDSTVTTTSLSYVKLKSITIIDSYTGSWRISYHATDKTCYGEIDEPTYSRIYKNGVPYGTEHMYQNTYTEDFNSISITNGDTIELWAHATNSGCPTHLAGVDSFRIKFDTVTSPPNIIDYLPISPVYDNTSSIRTFSISIDKVGDINWYINGTLVQTNTSITTAQYVNNSANFGIWNITAIASNANGAASQTWIWTVKYLSIITWNNPSDITYGIALNETQLNANASTSGTFIYNPISETILSAGLSQTLHTDFTPTDTTNYTNASKDVYINVLQAIPVITWSNPTDITFLTPLSGTQLNAAGSVSGSFIYTPSSGTILNASLNQILHTDFTPIDTTNYTTNSKNVYLNVLPLVLSPIQCNGWCYLMYDSTMDLTNLNNIYTNSVDVGWYNPNTKKYVTNVKNLISNGNVIPTKKFGYYYYFTSSQPISVSLTNTYTITLITGWNLVGNLNSSSRTLAQLKSSIGATATQAQYYNRTTKTWLSSDSTSVPPEESFFVYITSNTVWSN